MLGFNFGYLILSEQSCGEKLPHLPVSYSAMYPVSRRESELLLMKDTFVISKGFYGNRLTDH